MRMYRMYSQSSRARACSARRAGGGPSPTPEPLVAGGRYDGLMTQLGSTAPIPAVGFSVWVDALTRIGRKVGA